MTCKHEQTCTILQARYCMGIIEGIYFAPRPFAALASPDPRLPRKPPRAAPPLPAGAPPRPGPPAIRDGAGVENLGVAFEDVGGFSTKDVSVVLQQLAVIARALWKDTQERCFPVNLSVKSVRVCRSSYPRISLAGRMPGMRPTHPILLIPRPPKRIRNRRLSPH